MLNCLVQNEPGVLSRVSGILAGRGFNIDSLVVCSTEIRDLSRMCITLRGQDGVIEQARRQLEDLVSFSRAANIVSRHINSPRLRQVPVWAVLDYTNTHCIERELLLAKVSLLGPEYVDDQLAGGPTHEPRRRVYPIATHPAPTDKLGREVTLAEHFDYGAEAEGDNVPLTPSEVLRLKSAHMQSLSVLASHFGARVVDVSEHSVIVEMCGKTSRVDAFLHLLEPYGVLEAARTGASFCSICAKCYLLIDIVPRCDGYAANPNPPG